MIVLDTNVIFELMKEHVDQNVSAWLSTQKPTNLVITAIAIAEIQRGIMRLPMGIRRQQLDKSFDDFIQSAFAGRVLPFDERAANTYGGIAAQREKAGFNINAVDLMIAAICKTHNASIATRNVKDFRDCGIKLINPWEKI